MTIRFTPRARDDLREILQYIAKENPIAAERVGRAIFDTTALIAARPHLGIRNAKAPGLRSRLVTNIRTVSTISSRTPMSGSFTFDILRGVPSMNKSEFAC